MKIHDIPKKTSILVITSPKGIRNIIQKLKAQNIKVTPARLSEMTVLLAEDKTEVLVNKKPLSNYDFVWIQSAGTTKDIAYLLSLYLDHLKIPHSNPETEITKIVDLFNLSLHHLPIPKTYYCSKKNLLQNLPDIAQLLGYPFLIKSTVSWGGNDIHLITKASDFFAIVPDLPEHKKYTLQKFIPNTFDYRIIVGNGAVLSGEKRFRTKDSFRNNACRGATEVFLEIDEIPKKVKELAVKVAAVCDLSWAGVDIITNEVTGEILVLEVNRRPGLTKGSSETKAAFTYLKSIQENLMKMKGDLL